VFEGFAHPGKFFRGEKVWHPSNQEKVTGSNRVLFVQELETIRIA
jgi:hypothetical protein